MRHVQMAHQRRILHQRHAQGVAWMQTCKKQKLQRLDEETQQEKNTRQPGFVGGAGMTNETMIKYNCNSCLRLLSCETLLSNEWYQALSFTEANEYRNSHVCELYKCLFIEYPIEVAEIT